jgi:aryl-alcohol dehydrogenase-like predicted oxidoreductase
MSVLGATDLHVTRVGLGLAALGRPAYINLGRAADRPQTAVWTSWSAAHAVLDAAYAAGIRHFDAARSCGSPKRSWTPGCARATCHGPT